MEDVMIKRGEELLKKLQKENRVYTVPKDLSNKLTTELRNVSIKAHKDFIHQQNMADQALRDIKLI